MRREFKSSMKIHEKHRELTVVKCAIINPPRRVTKHTHTHTHTHSFLFPYGLRVKHDSSKAWRCRAPKKVAEGYFKNDNNNCAPLTDSLTH